MKKLVWLSAVALACPSIVWAAGLSETLAHRVHPVAVAVETPVNRSDDAALDVAALKKAIESRLAARRQPAFDVKADPSAAELAVSAEVVESYFTEHDPIDKMIGLGGTAWDAAHDDHYARLMTVFAVRDVRSGRVLWTDKLMATITDPAMSRDESRPKVAARAAEIFVREAFGKKRK